MTDDNALWVLEPRAHADDPIWQGRTIWRRVVVVAESAAFARLAAARWYLHDAGSLGPGNESPSPVAGFEDERLYTAKPMPETGVGDLPRSGGPVISAERLAGA